VHAVGEGTLKKCFSVSRPYSDWAWNFDAEMFAISRRARGALQYMKNHPEINNIKMYSDNSSAISVIFDPAPHPSQQPSIDFRNTIYEMFTINPEITFSLIWTPGHGGSKGMDIVDRLAKAGAKSKLKPIQSFASLSHVLSEIREKNPIKNWKEHIEDHPIKDDSLFFKNSQVLHPSLKPPKWFKKVSRPVTSRLTQFITGHGYTSEYFDRFKIPNRGTCDCSTTSATPYPPVPLSREHAIKACPLFGAAQGILQRHAPQITHRKWPAANLLKKDFLEHFITFLSESGALSRKYSTATGEPRPGPKN
jgi:ribonuclease HI